MANRLLILTALAILPSCGSTPPSAAPPPATVEATGTTGTTGPSPSVAPERRMVRWIDLQPGDCLADPPPTDPAVVQVRVVDCTEPHRAEAYLRAQVPVNAAISDTASAQCETGLPAYTGSPDAAARYRIAYLIDSEQDRTYNNPLPSTVICLLEGADGQWLDGPAGG